MWRVHPILLLALASFTATAAAQTPAVQRALFVVSAAPTSGAGANDVIERVMSFDRNSDGKVERGELIDRMQHLVSRGDEDGDGALDGAEIRALAVAPATTAPGSLLTNPYQIPQDTWFPDRSHIEGAIADLKLMPAATLRALAVVNAHQADVRSAQAEAAANLLRHVETVLGAEQFADFKIALARQSEQVQSIRVSTSANVANLSRRVVLRDDLERRIEQYRLAPAEKAQALGAVLRYATDLRRRGEVERSRLAKKLKGILSDEERENFGAALARRSAIPVGTVVRGMVKGLVGGAVAAGPDHTVIVQPPR